MSFWSAKRRQMAGWAAVSISTLVACFWAFWGSNENFHEGWFSPSVWQNIGLMFAQYLSPMLIVMLISILALAWPRLALPLFGASAVAVAWFFRGSHAAITLIVIPMLTLGMLYHFGRPEPRRWAWRCLIGLPLITMVVCGAYPGWLATHRLDDGNYGMRLIAGNGVTLIWAPEGPGWLHTQVGADVTGEVHDRGFDHPCQLRQPERGPSGSVRTPLFDCPNPKAEVSPKTGRSTPAP